MIGMVRNKERIWGKNLKQKYIKNQRDDWKKERYLNNKPKQIDN